VELGDSRPSFTLEDITKGLKNNEFEPFFQPRVEVATGRIVGARALARWRHPVMGKVEPHAFIRPLEESGLIDVLTWDMLRKASACCSAWHAAGLESTVSVRLAVRLLAGENLAARVTQTVSEQGLDPRHMILEVSDAAAAAQAGGELENLARLRVNGFGLSMRNHGSGYASLQQLTRIAFTELKFDQAHARNAACEELGKALLTEMIETARTLGITSVVEGVETQLDWDLVARLGCDLAQGYFIAAPMAAGAYADWARDHVPRTRP
jgi:EAL domain-containing protein (putative c-di-GMP-specific phosphodiesterase class I)